MRFLAYLLLLFLFPCCNQESSYDEEVLYGYDGGEEYFDPSKPRSRGGRGGRVGRPKPSWKKLSDETKEAFEKGDLEKIQTLIDEKKIQANQCDENGNSLLTYATSKEMVEKLIKQGAKPNAINKQGLSPLCTAKGLEVKKALLEAGADPHNSDGLGYTPITYAESPEEVKLFVENGVDPNENVDIGRGVTTTPLYNYFLNGFKDKDLVPILQEYIDQGLDVNNPRFIGYQTIPMVAVMFGYPKCLRCLLENGANPKLPGYRGLHALNYVFEGSGVIEKSINKLLGNKPLPEVRQETKKELVEVLLDFDVSLTHKSEGGNPIELARKEGFTDIVTKMEQKMQDQLVDYAIRGKCQKVEKLLRAGAKIDQSNSKGDLVWEALIDSFTNTSTLTADRRNDMMKALLINKFGFNSNDENNPLHIAVKKKAPIGVVDFLLNQNFDPRTKIENESILEYAKKNNVDPELIQHLEQKVQELSAY